MKEDSEMFLIVEFGRWVHGGSLFISTIEYG